MSTQIFAFPFAGGSSYSYNALFEHLPNDISYRTFELPGRGSQSRLPLNPDLKALARQVYHELKILRPTSCVFYGHSMGALLAYLVAIYINKNKDDIEIRHLLVTGCMAPSFRDVLRLSALPDEELVKKIITMEGTPNDLWQAKELWDFFIPVIRSDFRAFEEYVYEEAQPLHIPLTVVTGTDEFIKDYQLTGWGRVTTQPVTFLKMNGGHFFINEHPKEMAGLLAEICKKPVTHSSLP